MAATTAPSKLSWPESPRQSSPVFLVDTYADCASIRIVWPISADQPLNAIHLSENLDVAFELIEVRHGVYDGVYRTKNIVYLVR